MSRRRDLQHAKPELALKVASRALVRAAGGTDGAAETAGARQQRMSDVGLPNTGEFLRVDEVGALEDVTVGVLGHPHVTRALARRQGFELVRVPTSAPSRADMLFLLADHGREGGEVTRAACEALADGTIAPAEAERLAQEIEDEVGVLMAMLTLARAHQREGGR